MEESQETQAQEHQAQSEHQFQPDQQQPDPIKNLKSEFDRKLQNLNQSQEQLTQAVSQLANQLQFGGQENQQSESFEEDFYSDPNKALEKFESRIMSKLESQKQQEEQQKARVQEKYSQITSEFPEISQPNSKLLETANQYFYKLPVEQRQDPTMLENCVYRAASELGLRPASRRKQMEDTPRSNPPVNPEKKEGMTDNQVLLAKLLGRPVDSDDYKQKVGTISKRKDWIKYKPIKGEY